MAVILALGLILLATGISLLVRGLMTTGGKTGETLQQIRSYGFAGARGDGSEDGSPSRPLDDLAGTIGDYLSRRFSLVRETDMRVRLVSAGMYSTSPRKFVGYQALLGIALLLSWLWLSGVYGAGGVTIFAGIVASAVIGWMLPTLLVAVRTRQRREEIDYELPELIDLLVVSVEAGIGFTGSLRMAANRLRGPLGQELRLTLQEANMGLSTTEALENMLVRAETPGMRSFVRSIVQGETLGVSMGQIMRNLASEMRKRRRAAAEERAQKAPVKMLFPLIFLIFPALFVVILVPALITIAKTLGD